MILYQIYQCTKNTINHIAVFWSIFTSLIRATQLQKNWNILKFYKKQKHIHEIGLKFYFKVELCHCSPVLYNWFITLMKRRKFLRFVFKLRIFVINLQLSAIDLKINDINPWSYLLRLWLLLTIGQNKKNSSFVIIRICRRKFKIISISLEINYFLIFFILNKFLIKFGYWRRDINFFDLYKFLPNYFTSISHKTLKLLIFFNFLKSNTVICIY